MAKKTTPKPQAVDPAQIPAPDTDAAETQTPIIKPEIEEATAQAEGNPMPPALGNEGTAAEAGEGQSSLADTAGSSQHHLDYQQQVRQLVDDYAPRDLKATLASQGGEPSLVVTGPKQGRWRIGRKFGPEPVILSLPGLTEDDLKALIEDKALTVTAVAPPY